MDILHDIVPSDISQIITSFYNPYKYEHDQRRRVVMVEFFKTLNKMRMLPYLKNNLSVAESQLEQSAPPYGYCPYENAHMYILYIMWLKRVDEIEPQSDTRRLQI